MSVATRTVVFAAYCVAVVFGNWPVLRGLYDLSRRDPSASHLLLIPLVTIALLARHKSIFSAARVTPWAGVGVIIGGFALGWGASLSAAPGGQENALTWGAGALVVMWLGGFLFLYGAEVFRAGLFPLLFLGFMIPIPPAVLERATSFLKAGTAEIVSVLFSLVGTPYHRQEFVFSLPNVTIQVADACSGIRSTVALLLTARLVGYFYLTRYRNRALLLLVIVPLTILKNGVRIVSLSLLSIHVDRGFLDGRLHHDGGIVFFLVSLLILYPFFLLLLNSETRVQAQSL
jgi:exosortase